MIWPFVFLRNWFWRPPRQRPDLHVILYTRDSCPLCDEAADTLQDFQRRHGFVLESQNVDASAELQRAYCDCVPVVSINGRVRFRGHVNPILLQRILDVK